MALTVKQAVQKVDRARVFLERCERELEALLQKDKYISAKTRRKLADHKTPKWMDAEMLENQY